MACKTGEPASSQRGVFEGRVEHLFHKPAGSDLQTHRGGRKASGAEVSSFERVLEGMTRVLAPEES
jgi:hypothetical protein